MLLYLYDAGLGSGKVLILNRRGSCGVAQKQLTASLQGDSRWIAPTVASRLGYPADDAVAKQLLCDTHQAAAAFARWAMCKTMCSVQYNVQCALLS